jgi:hypothetical protein
MFVLPDETLKQNESKKDNALILIYETPYFYNESEVLW